MGTVSSRAPNTALRGSGDREGPLSRTGQPLQLLVAGHQWQSPPVRTPSRAKGVRPPADPAQPSRIPPHRVGAPVSPPATAPGVLRSGRRSCTAADGRATASGTRGCRAGSCWQLPGLTPPTQPPACWGHPAPPSTPNPPPEPTHAKSPTVSACIGDGWGVRTWGCHPPHTPALRQAGLPAPLQWLYPRAAALSPPVASCPHLTESPSRCFPARRVQIRHVQHPTPRTKADSMSC